MVRKGECEVEKRRKKSKSCQLLAAEESQVINQQLKKGSKIILFHCRFGTAGKGTSTGRMSIRSQGSVIRASYSDAAQRSWEELRLRKQTINIILILGRSKEMQREEQLEVQSGDSNPSVQFQYLTSKIYDELLSRHQQAKRFIAELGPLKETAIIDSLANYCRDFKLGLKTCQMVSDLMEARLNKIIKNNKLKKNWSTEDLEILVWLLSKYMEKNGLQSHQLLVKQDWNNVALLIPGASPHSCMFKFIGLKKFKLAQHKWQKDEEALLLAIIQEIGVLNWKLIAQRLYDQSNKKKIFRTPKQCREHWSCYLDPRIKKGPWEKEEDKKLLQIVLDSSCQKKWSAIKLDFEGRTENALKNRYNLLLEKQKKINPSCSESQLLKDLLKEDKEEQTSDKVENVSTKKESSSFIPLIPQERRHTTIPYHPGLIIFFSNGESYQL